MLCAYINTIKPAVRKQNQWVVQRYVLVSSTNPYSYEILNKEIQHVVNNSTKQFTDTVMFFGDTRICFRLCIIADKISSNTFIEL